MNSIKRTIILCWIMLIVCFIIKLFGGNWFEIMCNNEHFIYICNYIDQHAVVKHAISFVPYLLSTYLILCASSLIPRTNKTQTIVLFIIMSFVWSTQFINSYVKLFCEIVMYIVIPTILPCVGKEKIGFKKAIKKNWYRGIVGCALCLVFQIVSLITKNIGIKIVDDNTLVSLISIIDYYIMILLYYLYFLLKSKKEE